MQDNDHDMHRCMLEGGARVHRQLLWGKRAFEGHPSKPKYSTFSKPSAPLPVITKELTDILCKKARRACIVYSVWTVVEAEPLESINVHHY